MNITGIEWTTFSANPLKYRDAAGTVVWGCVKTSPGCAHCYSEAIAERYRRGGPFTEPIMAGLTPFLDEAELHKMRTARMIGGVAVPGSRCFIGDMTDIFGEWVPDDLLNQLFSNVLEARTDVTWQILTKRAERMHRYLSWRYGEGRIPSRHIHFGVSVENNRFAQERILLLLQSPAAVRFISAEPLLAPMDLDPFVWPACIRTRAEHDAHCDGGMWCDERALDWVIVGGESGPGARPFNAEWARSIVKQCASAAVPVFVKQMGANSYDGLSVVNSHRRKLYLKKKGNDMAEWPADLRIREFPQVGRDGLND